MKRKLITLLVAFLVLAGYQQAFAVRVVISAGDSLTSASTYYSGTPLLNSKLSFVSGAFQDGSIKYVHKSLPVTTKPTSDRFNVYSQNNSDAGTLISFIPDGQTTPLTLSYGRTAAETTDYKQFTVFKGATLDAAQKFNGGTFEGFVGINLANAPDYESFLLVVYHKTTGELKLMPYEEYAKQAKKMYVGDAGIADTRSQTWWPLYIKSTPLGGRWATPEDFEKCYFTSFNQLKGDNKDADGTLNVKGVTNFHATSRFRCIQQNYHYVYI